MKESTFQIAGSPRIVESSFKLNREYASEENVDIKFDVATSVQVDPETGEVALVDLKIEIFKEDDFAEVPFKITVIAEGLFKWNEETAKDEKVLESLLNQNAPAILYGYIRQEIRLMTLNAGIPTLDIPVMNFTDN